MFNLNEVFKIECQFASGFTDLIKKPYGIIYFNTNNPHSYDSNHAHIFDLSQHLETAIDDICSFYSDRQITPRIRTSFIDNEKELLFPLLINRNFKIESVIQSFMLCNNQRKIIKPNNYHMFRIESVTYEIEQIVYSENLGDWKIKVLMRHLKDPSFHLLGLSVDGICLAIASLKVMDGYSRIDDVLVHANHRRIGLGTKLLIFLVNYHFRISTNYLYLYTENRNAIGMYEKTGFELKTGRECWSAYTELPYLPSKC
jgi:ribosomal protein S18 acetylase RimI-like enzyme